MNRRTFIYSTALSAAHFGLIGLPYRVGAEAPGTLKVDIVAPDVPLSPMSMPGLFPGRVIETTHGGAIVGNRISQPAVREMLDRGMEALVGGSTPEQAWSAMFHSADTVGIKVNPSGTPTTVTSIPLIREVIRNLNAVGVPNRQIIVYDRNSNQMEVVGYHNMLPAGVRVVGLDRRWIVEDGTRAGYDPDVFCEMNCFGERETRSYLASVVTTEATKLINLPTLKEHNASGVTGCLKNLAYGSFNNVARTHVFPKTYTDPVIAVMCTAAPLRTKSVLHIMDGIRAVYHGGPFAWNPDFVWEANKLLIGTDPVAVDRVELEIVEAKRKAVGAPSLWDRDPANLGSSAEMQQTPHKNRFYREPGHIKTASELGLGRWELAQIDHRRLQVG